MNEPKQDWTDKFAVWLGFISLVLGSNIGIIPIFFVEGHSRGAKGQCQRGPYTLTMGYRFEADWCQIQLSVAKGGRTLNMSYDGQWHCQSARNPSHVVHNLPAASAKRLMTEMIRLVAKA